MAGTGAVSCQVLAEFFTVATAEISAPLSVAEAYDRIGNFLRIWRVLDLTGLIVLEAARGVKEHRFSFRDAQIWAAARLNQIPLILSENFADQSVIEGVRFINPFRRDFQLGDWLA